MRGTIPLILSLSALLAACGGGAAPAASSAPVSQAAAVSPAASKPAASSSAASTSAKPAASTSNGGAKEKLSMAYTAPTLAQLPPMVAKEEGYFDQNGIDADVTLIGAGSQPQAALLGNQIQMYEGGPDVISASIAGADLEFFGAAETAFLFDLYGAPNVKTAADLKGGKVAVTSLTSSTYTAARLAVKQLGLDPDKDVTYIAVNNPPAILSAMETGAVQAGTVGPTNISQVQASGKFNLLADISKLNQPYPAGWWAVSKKWADGHDATMQHMTKALVQAVAYMIQQPDGTKQVLAKYSKNNDPVFLNGNYQVESPHLQKVPYADVKGVELVLQELSATIPAAKTADANKYVDNHWVKALDDSGFINSLYK
ncbi:MAG TPA: ABC transporter substrate-binding protein [Chloroflexota bacterium]|nr:ABC transporter substrate-binding protein [Chloroflexota bacterium]